MSFDKKDKNGKELLQTLNQLIKSQNKAVSNSNSNQTIFLKTLTKVLESQNALLETNNPVKFEYKFPGKNHETLPWIFAAEKFLRVHDFKTPKVRFQRIFASLNEEYQNRYFIDTKGEEDPTTFDALKSWVLKKYPPPKTKHEFRTSLKSMLMYRGEDPNIAYSRWEYKLAKIHSAIKIINKGLKIEANDLYPNDADLDDDDDDEDDNHNNNRNATESEKYYKSIKMKQISSEDKLESLRLMFVIRNNSIERNNNSEINKMTKRFIMKYDPKTLDDWKKAFVDMKTKLIPKVLEGQQEYEFVSYSADPDADNIYTKKRHQSITPQRQHTSKHHRNPSKQQYHKRRGRQPYYKQSGPPQKKQRTIKCRRCHKPGHYMKDCYAKTDINGNPIQSHSTPHKSTNNRSSKCKICGIPGHSSRRCFKRDELKNKQCGNCGAYGHATRACLKPNNSNPNKSQSHFTRYPSQSDAQHQKAPSKPISKQAEINTISRSSEAQSVIDDVNQWISNHDDATPDIRSQLETFTQSLLSKYHPRK